MSENRKLVTVRELLIFLVKQGCINIFDWEDVDKILSNGFSVYLDETYVVNKKELKNK